MNILILSLIIIGLVIHKYLTAYWENGILPYSAGFLMLANLFLLIYLISYIWMFGFFVGVILFALTFFQVIYSCYLWISLLPSALMRMHKPQVVPTVSLTVYAIWPYIVMATGILTIANFFVSDYGSFTELLIESLDGNVGLLIIVIAISMAVGNLTRSVCLKRLLSAELKPPQEIESVLEIPDEAERIFNNSGFQAVRNIIEKMLFGHPNKYTEITSGDMPPRQWVFLP